jgi:signal transduction histidine kinase/ligand-binding sensor domain-containing protein/DNA-binding response OmpR family regulator
MTSGAISYFIRPVVLAAIILGCAGTLNAQKRNFRFNYYTTDDGLSQNMVDCIFQDSKGFMWFGTWNGLNRFDGYTFRTYSPGDQGEYRLGSIFIYDIEEDPSGNLWIGTADGLNVYLYEKDRFLQYTHEPGNDSTISSNQVNCLMVDDAGTLWVGTDRGLDRIVPGGFVAGLTDIRHITDPSGRDNGQGMVVQDLYQDQSGRIWAGTDGGLALLGPADTTFTLFTYQPGNLNSLSSNDVQSILQDREGNLWIGTNYGLNRFDAGSRRFHRYFHDPADESSLVHNSVMDIAEDIRGNLIFGTLGGISMYDRAGDIFHNYTYNSSAVTELNNEFVNCLYADADGNVWIGTERGGINQFNVHQNEFDYYVSIPGKEQSLSSNTINSVWEDGEALWVGTAGGGLNRIVHSGGTYTHYRADPSVPASISGDFVTCIHRDITGCLLIGTWGEGLNLLTPENEAAGKFINLRHDPADDRSLVNNFISFMVEDSHGVVWIGTYGGIVAFLPESRHFIAYGLGSATPISRVGCLEFDIYNNLWAGTEEGLYFIPSGDSSERYLNFNHVTRYLPSRADSGSISGKYIISINDDSYGNLWVGTYGNGLNKLPVDRLDRPVRSFIHYTDRDGLCNNTIYGIQEDRNGNLWLSTDNGLSRFNQESERFTNYYVVDGLLHNQFYWSASFRNASGVLYFGSMNGLLSFNPAMISEHAIQPGVILTDFKIYNQPVDVGETFYDRVAIENPVCVADRIILSHKIREFSLDFSALYYEHPDKVFYAYMMAGFDDDWHYVSSRRRYASYTNLKGGKYTFMVKASLEEGHYESEPLELEISILPPFWVKPWFITALVLVLVTSLISYNRFRVFSLRRRQKELEQLVAERTAQIMGQKEQLEKQNTEILQQRDKLMELNKKVQQSNQQQMRFFTHMSHEFRTPLTLIITPLEQMIREVSSRSPHYRTLVLMKRNAQRLLHLINQLMEVRRIKTGKMELKASKGELVGFLENITQSFYELAKQKEIIFEFSSNPGRITCYFDRDKVENILYNLLSNAFKYTPEGGQISVNVARVNQKVLLQGDVTIIAPPDHRQPEVGEYAEISVMDTGYGIDADDLKNIFKRFFRIQVADIPSVQNTGIGLYLTKELIRTHKGQLYINSRKGQGTTFTILLPLGSTFLSLDEIAEQGREERKPIPKLHVDLLSGQMEQKRAALESPLPEMNGHERSNSLVMVIDDDMDMMRFTADHLGESFSVITAHDGLEGLEKVRQYMPDLIITDIIMPGMDGLELCTRLKSDIVTSHIPVILLTSRSEAEDFLEGMEYGALDYIAKPFDIELLEAKVRNLIHNQERLKKLYTSTRMEDLVNAKKVKVQDHFLHKVIGTIEEHMANPQFGVKELANELCISRSLLHKKLISAVNQPANSFINSIRLKRAALLLLEGDHKVSEIAFEVGFNDPKYFSKIFKKHFGKTPSGYVESNISVYTQFST